MRAVGRLAPRGRFGLAKSSLANRPVPLAARNPDEGGHGDVAQTRQVAPWRAILGMATVATLGLGSTAALEQQQQQPQNQQSVKMSTTARATPGLLELEEPVKLYQYASCPFCNKTQAFMEFHGIPYTPVEVNPISKEQIKFSDYRMVPIAHINGEQVNGSGTIISTLLGGEGKISAEEAKWCNWVDDHLVHLLPVNIYRTAREALQSFDYITRTSGDFSLYQQYTIRYVGALAMYFVAKRGKKKYNLGDDPRKELYDAIDEWTTNGLGSKRFHGGDSPDTADLAVFGVLRSIDGNYQTWADLEAHTLRDDQVFWNWFNAVKASVAANKSIVPAS
mmetsp:Transcript_5717/g.10246  ORF Transcript_5717/g.10246 Transcript_5717/m.10246 type:complete len:335 (-) Transcript_5717:8-1012(-)